MKLGHSLGASALAFVMAACGLGDGADIGDSTDQPIGSKGGSMNDGSGGAAESGGASESGGATQGAGGASHNSGGAVQASGGRAQSTGGAKQSTGGVSQGTGGLVQGTGGVKPGTGGSTGGVKCGSNTCGAGQYCCNASCGICAPMGGACIQIACDPPPPDAGTCVQNVACVKGTAWSPTQCKCIPEGGTCTTVGDCQLVSDYCGGCNCLALSQGQKAPACSGQMVACLIDPCELKSLACVSGRCVAQ
jgi:hypothetical protein